MDSINSQKYSLQGPPLSTMNLKKSNFAPGSTWHHLNDSIQHSALEYNYLIAGGAASEVHFADKFCKMVCKLVLQKEKGQQ